MDTDTDTDMDSLCDDLKKTNVYCPIANNNNLVESFEKTKIFIAQLIENECKNWNCDVNKHLLDVSLRYTEYNQRNVFDRYPYLNHFLNLYSNGMSDKLLFNNESFNNLNMLLLSHFIDSTVISIIS
jgi:hypothetical protein